MITADTLTAALADTPSRSCLTGETFGARTILDAVVHAYERGDWNDEPPAVGTALFRAAYGIAYAIQTGRVTAEVEREVEALKGDDVIALVVEVGVATKTIGEVAGYLNGRPRAGDTCPRCGRGSLFARPDGALICSTCKGSPFPGERRP